MSETRRLYLTTMGYVDLSEYLLKTEAETLYATIDLVNNKQDKLISGTNIKTVNGNSLLGSGNITIEGGGDYLPLTGGTIDGYLSVLGTIASPTMIVASGGVHGHLRQGDYILGLEGKNIVWGTEGGDDEYYITTNGDGTKFLSNDGTYKTISSGGSGGGSSAYPENYLGTSSTTLSISPNVFYVWDEVSSLTLAFSEGTSGVANEYLFQFTSGSTPTTLSLPDDIKWANDSAPTIAENKIYQISVLKGLGSCLEFDNATSKIDNLITYDSNKISFQYPVASEVTVVFYGRPEGAAISSAPMDVTLVYAVGEQTKGCKSVFNIVSITPSEDNTYNYLF